MVAPAGKAPKHQLSAEEKRKLMDLKRRERRIRRANDPAPQRPPSIRIKEALRKGRLPVSTSREQDFSSEQASNAPNNAENKTKQPTTKNPVVGEGKTTTQQFTSAHGVNSTVQETVASLVRVVQLVDDLGPSDDESDSSPPLDSTSFLSPTLPPTLRPTSATCTPVFPTSRPTSTTTIVDPPTSEETENGVPPTSEPTLATSVTKRKRKRTNNSDSSTTDLDDDCLATGVVVGDGENVGDDDPCFMEVGDAEKETALDSESEESSSEIGEFEPNEEYDESWELPCPSDEDENDPAEELPDSELMKTATNKNLMKNMRKTGWEYDSTRFGSDPQYAELYKGSYGPKP